MQGLLGFVLGIVLTIAAALAYDLVLMTLGDDHAVRRTYIAGRPALAKMSLAAGAGAKPYARKRTDMCAGAIYWAGIGRVVFGLRERRLKSLTGDHADNPTLDLPCRVVFAAGQRPVEAVGPLLEDEAAALHAGAWTS